ncbi:uncharacterized protein C20orf96 [Lingula anatina]|uniref:Uncharacterized protein C20orf96 n=1 Tax=Lingula anatina TaxID=7574 RepID=A0A1S3J2H7_LINAN|nr:uncharacterized protein C20orf96 [Lingula anatina]|eukprot:XP_013404453.1 uncharacterized protein C20orf96 [Lingula anatina]
MPGGWGRKAAGRIDRTQFGDDELLKSLGGEYNVDFTDYAQWQRTGLQAVHEHAKKSASGLVALTPERSPFTVGAGGSPFASKRIGSASSTCRHGAHKKEGPPETEEDKKRTERIKILQLRIRSRRQTLEEYKNRYYRLMDDNVTLRQEIDGVEEEAHDDVKKQLRTYEKFRGGMTKLQSRFVTDLDQAKTELRETKIKTETELAALQKLVDAVDVQLKAKQDELHVLLNYKDKEYPVKAIRIADLENEIENVQISNEEDQLELEHIIDTEIGKLKKNQNSVQKEITEHVTKEAIAKMHPSLKDMALQNMVMKKEMEFHQKEIDAQEQQNKELEDSIKQLLQDPQTNIKLQLFPEFFPMREKCTPDMEVVLDIPTQEWLPI